ncbi:unnamed protein product [Closterium sp. Yama58-4]|nr:unnamed protein product [Closterium sp. Yama58-4]
MANPSFQGGASPHGLDVRGMLQLARQRVDEGQPSAALQLIIAVLRAQGGEAAVLAALTRARAMHHNQRQMQQLQQGADDITALLARCAIGSADVAVPAGTGQMASGGSATAWGGGDVGMGGSNSMGEQRGNGPLNGGMEGFDGYASHSGYGSEQTAMYGMQPTASGFGIDQAGRQGIDPAAAAAAYGMESAGRHGVDGAAILAEQGRMQVVADAAADGSSVTCIACGGVISGARWKEHVQFWCRAAVQDPMGDSTSLSP